MEQKTKKILFIFQSGLMVLAMVVLFRPLLAYAQTYKTYQECIQAKQNAGYCSQFPNDNSVLDPAGIYNSNPPTTPTYKTYEECINAGNTIATCQKLPSGNIQINPAGVAPSQPNPGTVPSANLPPYNGTECGGDPNYVYKNGICVPNPIVKGGIADSNTLMDVIVIVMKYLLYFAGAIAVVFVIIGGYWYITAGGNEETSEKGRKTLMNAIIGVVVVILAYVIITVLTNLITKGPS